VESFEVKCCNETIKHVKSVKYLGLQIDNDLSGKKYYELLKLGHVIKIKNKTSPYYLSANFQNLNESEDRIVTRSKDKLRNAVQSLRYIRSAIKEIKYGNFQFKIKITDLIGVIRISSSREPLYKAIGPNWISYNVFDADLVVMVVVQQVWISKGCSTRIATEVHSDIKLIKYETGLSLETTFLFIYLRTAIKEVRLVPLFFFSGDKYAFPGYSLEESGFSSLTYLLDDSGLIYPSGPLLSNVIHPGRDVRLNFGRVMEQCQEGQASYQVFKLNYFFDVEKEVDYRTTLDLRGVLGNINVNLSHVQLLSSEAEDNLSNFLKSIKIDMQPYRYEVEKPLVRKNMPALAEQMQNVAGQMRSVTASSELFKLVSRTRNFIKNVVYPLEKRKEDIAYQVATLDMEVMPLQRQINQSAGHLRTIQYFINNHGSSLAQTKVQAYTDRILSYVRQYSDHVRNQALRQVAPCTSLWRVFDSARGVTCNGIIDPVNAFWLATTWCLLLFIPGIAVVLWLSKYYLRMDEDDDGDTLPLHNGMVGSPSSDKFPSSENWGSNGGINVRHTHHHAAHMHHAHHHHR
ncbi:unnamed protein product, partial [Meganyctiphanes norvegica]